MNPNDSEQQRHNPQAMRFKSWLPRLLATQAWEYFLISLNLASDFFLKLIGGSKQDVYKCQGQKQHNSLDCE